MIPGRTCPADYTIGKNAFVAVTGEYDSAYIIGGLYGNREALRAIKEMQRRETELTSSEPVLIFNGDTHWFDYRYRDFIEIEKAISGDIRLLGNVEAEMRRDDDIGAGCGCSYPYSTSDEAVERSNEIHLKLKKVASSHADVVKALNERDAVTSVKAGGIKVAVTTETRSLSPDGDVEHRRLIGGSYNARIKISRQRLYMAKENRRRICRGGRSPLRYDGVSEMVR